MAILPFTTDYRRVKTDRPVPPVSERSLRLDPDCRWHRPKRVATVPRGEPQHDERPVRSTSSSRITASPANQLPFPDSQFDRVECGTVFAYLRNDEGLARELARVTMPGGTITLRVPAAGPLAVFDAFNLHRYLVDTTKHGLRPFETADIGWRRHYSENDVTGLFDTTLFQVIAQRRSGVAASEAVRLSGFMLFRWFRASRNGYRRVAKLAQRVLAIEDRVAWRHGFWLEMTLQRTDQPAGAEPGRSAIYDSWPIT